jgi:hypothetical protein
MFDHPQNYGYPSYWHARGYGLFSVNNLGARAYDEKAVPVELKLKPGESILFKHRLYISSGDHPGTAKLEALSKAFGEK